MKKTRLYLILILGTLTSSNVFPQASDMDDRETKIINQLIEAINSPDQTRLERFITDNIANKDGASFTKQRLDRFKQITGNVVYEGVYHSKKPIDNETILKVTGNNYELLRTLFLVYETPAKNSLKEVDFGLYRKVEHSISEGDMIQKVTEIVDKLSERDLFSGAVLIAKKHDVLYKNAVGEASKRYHVKNKVDTKFNLGSMNKMFTSLAIMKLVEKGGLQLDDTIEQFIDESWLPKNITQQITIRHLISHSSGLGSYFNPTFFQSSRDLFLKLDDYKPLVKDETLAFKPGEKYQYSNTGMLLLGVIVEKVTGEDYFEHIKNEIYNPANMKNSDAFRMDQPVENLAIGYTKANNKFGFENNLFKHVIRGAAAGGGFSTVEDLHKFAMALLNEKIVEKSTLDLMWKDYYTTHNYGYGFKVEDYDNEMVVGHSGGFYGVSADLSIFTKSGYIVSVLSNYEGGEQLSHKIAHLILSIEH